MVTGASSGIGEAFARALGQLGFHLVLVARREAVLGTLGTELQRAHGIDYRVVSVDLAEPGFLDTLLERDVAVNALAHAKLAHHFGGRLAQRGSGGILLVSSIAGHQPVPYLASYAASKSFVTAFAGSLHRELRCRGVTVTVLVAGPTDTPMRSAMGFGRSRLRPMTPEECVLDGLRALARGKVAHVPGARTRFLLWLLPRSVITRVMGRMTAAFARRPSPRVDARSRVRGLSSGDRVA